ncbi:hypothetical protein [Candidatus Rhodobacter oscarellae]|uniref:hypothetical protein n=1 Tax=Candidatus Rhodobacter oscarellae TaxID=1675527 RepID=UPI0006713954|nr:hypothetical protein [Candidatus Rhodobacter lobularis]
MDLVLHVFIGGFSALIVASGAAATFVTYRRCDEAKIVLRLSAPPIFFGFVLFCYGVYGVLSLFDPESVEPEYGFANRFFSIFGVGVIASLKNVFAPLVVAITLAWGIYQWGIHDSWELIPLYEAVVEGLLFWAPQWLQTAYIYVSLAYMSSATVASLKY